MNSFIRRSVRLFLLAGFSGVFSAGLAHTLAEPWSMSGGNAGRTGYTTESIPDDLQLLWKYQSDHKPAPAWPRSDRQLFDHAIRPVVVGQRVFFGDTTDGKVAALDAKRGELVWTFYTAGPVRLAPAAWQDRLFVVSDDGFLYCLSQQDGSLLWKHRGAKSGQLRLGNGRLISKWPARGGPVVVEDTVYYAAGIWPSDGISLYALDANSGEVRWTNDDSGGLYMKQPHGGAEAFSGVSAQGAIAACGDQLFVPTGRSVPAAFSRIDGKFQYFHLQRYRRKHSRFLAADDNYFFAQGSIYDRQTGRVIAEIADGPIVPVSEGLVIASAGKVVSYRWEWQEQKIPLDTKRPKKGKDKTTKDKEEQKPEFKIVRQRVLKKEAVLDDLPTGSSLIVAGNSLVTADNNRIAALNRTTKKVIWKETVSGTVHSLAAADGRLYASTTDGTIYCFGDGNQPTANGVPTSSTRNKTPDSKDDSIKNPYGENKRAVALVDKILASTDFPAGFCLDYGCNTGELSFELARRTNLSICAVDFDPQKVATARKRLAAAGLLGTRVSVHLLPREENVLPRYFANLIVSAHALHDANFEYPEKLLEHVQRPYGGVACLMRDGLLSMNRRAPLPGAGQWTHQYADAGNTSSSNDERVQGKLGILWFRDFNWDIPQRHGRGPAPLSYQGRLFYTGMNGILAVDAYNGTELWSYSIAGLLKPFDGDHMLGISGTGSIYCVGKAGLFVRHEDYCLRIDPASGKLLGKFMAPEIESPNGGQTKEETPAQKQRLQPPTDDSSSKRENAEQPQKKDYRGPWGYLAVSGDTLYGTRANRQHVVRTAYRGGGQREKLLTEANLVFALDAKTGKLKWSYRPHHSIRHNAIALGESYLFLIDRPLAKFDKQDAPQSAEKIHSPGTLVALDKETGKVVWKKENDIFGTMLMVNDDFNTVVMCYQSTRFKIKSEIGGRIAAFRANTGEQQWSIKANYTSRPIINGYKLYTNEGCWDLIDGKQLPFKLKKSYGCGQMSAASNTLFFRSATMGYYKLSGDEQQLKKNENLASFGGMRPGCWINLIPAGGLLLAPDASAGCTCSYLNRTWLALEPLSEKEQPNKQ